MLISFPKKSQTNQITLDYLTPVMPEDKPRYLMGVGSPDGYPDQRHHSYYSNIFLFLNSFQRFSPKEFISSK